MKRKELRKVIVTTKGRDVEPYNGYFHSWGQEIGSHNRTMGNAGSLITIAIIEKEDGTITTELPSSIKFDDDYDKKLEDKLKSTSY